MPFAFLLLYQRLLHELGLEAASAVRSVDIDEADSNTLASPETIVLDFETELSVSIARLSVSP